MCNLTLRIKSAQLIQLLSGNISVICDLLFNVNKPEMGTSTIPFVDQRVSLSWSNLSKVNITGSEERVTK